jgi:hypothetical protein
MRDRPDDIDIKRELHAARPEASHEFVSMLADRVHEGRARRRVAPRMALAFAATVGALAVAAAFGGISQAASSVENAVSSIVHVGHKAKPPTPTTGKGSVTAAPTSSSASSASTGPNGGSHKPPPPLGSPGSPSEDEYGRTCVPGFRGPYIACRLP